MSNCADWGFISRVSVLRERKGWKWQISSRNSPSLTSAVTHVKSGELTVVHPLQLSDQLDGFLAEHAEVWEYEHTESEDKNRILILRQTVMRGTDTFAPKEKEKKRVMITWRCDAIPSKSRAAAMAWRWARVSMFLCWSFWALNNNS